MWYKEKKKEKVRLQLDHIGLLNYSQLLPLAQVAQVALCLATAADAAGGQGLWVCSSSTGMELWLLSIS